MEEHVIELNGTIYNGYNGRDYIQYFLNKSNGKPVRLKVNSYGGDVNQAIAISKLLQDNGNVTVEFIGFNASAATWMAFGAKNIEIHEDAMWLAHKSSFPVEIWGSMNMDDIDNTIKDLENKKKSAEAVDLMIASKYADRCKKPIKDVLDLMTESRWMSANEAKEWGFVDVVIPGINKSKPISNEVIENLLASGLPKPTLNEEGDNQANNTNQEDPSTEDKPLTENFIRNFFRTMFPNNKEEKQTLTNQITSAMNKNYVAVNKILNLEGLEENEGKITLTNEQFKLINDALTAAETSTKEVQNKLDTALNHIDTLSPEVKNAATIEAKVTLIKNVLEKVPGMKPSSPDNNEGSKNDFNEIAVDPINNFEEY